MSEPSSPTADEFRMAGAVGTPSRPHFGRDLWVFLLLVLAGFAGALWILNRAWHQHEHVVEIGRAGGQAIYDWQLVEGELDPGRSPPWWTQAMARFPSGPDVLTRVAYVDLSEATDFERGLSASLGLKDLRGLDLGSPDATGAVLARLQPLKQLERIRLTGASIADSDLVYLPGLRQLRELEISLTTVTDDGLVHLLELPRLEHLDLGQTRVSDRGLEILARFPHLTRLTLDGTNISDAGLVRIAEMDSLEWLSLRDTRVTEAGVRALKKRRPGLKVVTTD